MIFLKYVGNHKKDTLDVQLGWGIIRLVQTGEFQKVTHSECVLAGDNYRKCTIASSSLRDGGVRIKENIELTKGNWRAFEVKEFKEADSLKWFQKYEGEPYNFVGTIATKVPGLRWLALALRGYFCNWACLSSVGIPDAYKETPSQSTKRLVYEYKAQEVTDTFFKD